MMNTVQKKERFALLTSVRSAVITANVVRAKSALATSVATELVTATTHALALDHKSVATTNVAQSVLATMNVGATSSVMRGAVLLSLSVE